MAGDKPCDARLRPTPAILNDLRLQCEWVYDAV